MKATIVLLPGDGIGPEIVSATRKVLDRVAEVHGHEFSYSEQLIGGAAIDDSGSALPEQTVSACKAADAILLGAVGGPKWDDPNASVRPEQGLLGIRKQLGLFANLRPVKAVPALYDASPLKNDRLEGVDILVVRELTGGLYFGKRGREKTESGERAFDTLEYTDAEIRRVVQLACKIARSRKGRVTSVDKANVLDSSRLWRQVATEVGGQYPDITMDHQLVDAAAMRLITSPRDFDVIVTENMFGDILTDEASVLTGSLGMLASASLGQGALGLYEPIHGSAPDIAGQGVANPLGTVLSSAMLLRHSLGLEAEAAAVEKVAFDAVDAGKRTKDLGGDLNTEQMTEVLVSALGER